MFDFDPGRSHLLLAGATVRSTDKRDGHSAGELAVFGGETEMERICVPALGCHDDLGLHCWLQAFLRSTYRRSRPERVRTTDTPTPALSADGGFIWCNDRVV
jgi:hypothetical protein